MFGQTIAYVKKEREDFLLVAGDEKSTDKRAFEERYGLRLEDFMDDLAMKGEERAGEWIDNHHETELPRDL